LKLKNSVECRFCGELKVPGGALASHEKSCANGGPTKRKRSKYRELFFANNGSGPYLCFFDCGQKVEFEEVIIHHVDGDHTNNEIKNLVSCHRICHNSYHFTELWSKDRELMLSSETRGHRAPHSEKTKLAISENHKKAGIKPSAEAIKKAAEFNTGSKKSDLAKSKMSDYASNRTQEHQEKLNKALSQRVISTETRRRMSNSAKARTDRKRSQGGDAL
jgi:hypothetical protein